MKQKTSQQTLNLPTTYLDMPAIYKLQNLRYFITVAKEIKVKSWAGETLVLATQV